MSSTFFEYFFSFLTVIGVLFQIVLAMGKPWGHLVLGGRYPGKFPQKMRVGALIQAVLLAFLAFIVLSRAGVAFPELFNLSNILIWVAVGISAISLVLNLIPQTKWERILWAPVAFLMTCRSGL